MAAPCGLYLSKILLPETGTPETTGAVAETIAGDYANVIDAAAGGAADGMRLAINVAAMLIAFLAFIAMIDFVLGWLGPGLSLARIFAVAFAPAAVLLGGAAGRRAGAGRSAWHQARHQRVRGVREASRGVSRRPQRAVSGIGDVCANRVRQLRVGGDSPGRDWRNRADAARRPGASELTCAAGWILRHADKCIDCGGSPMIQEETPLTPFHL